MKPELVTATSRAARMVAGLVSETHGEDWMRPLHEARAERRVVELAMALALRCAELARRAYDDCAQAEMDDFAFRALSREHDGAY